MSLSAGIGKQSMADSERAKWLGTIPLVVAETHDGIPLFSGRRGGANSDEQKEYDYTHTEEFAAHLEDLGVTLLIAYFYKGFGIEAERKYIDTIRDFAPVLKMHKVKVGLYIGSTICYETFLKEKPEAAEWFVPDYLGHPVIYDHQTFRKRVYFMHPGYLEYMKHVMRIGVEEVKADEMSFDNTSMQAEPKIFQHPLAAEHFREYLRTKYTPVELKKRFGFGDVRYVQPPKPDWPLGAIDDPLFQEWTDFRCHQLTSFYAQMKEVIEGANPGVVIDTNPHSEISGRNTIWQQGVNYPSLFDQMDVVWSEEGDPAGITEDGILVNRIRSFKNASILGKTLVVSTGGPGGSALQIAESLAFGRQCAGDFAGLWDAEAFPEEHRRYIRFFHDQFDYYRDVDNVADVAVLYSYASMGFNNDLPAVSFYLFTQALIQAQVPFNIIFDQHLKDLSRYRALVLGDQECLDDDQMNAIRQYVNRGGGLVATELTSLFTPWRLRRPDFGLKDLFGVHAPPYSEDQAATQTSATPPVRCQAGQGRVSYIAAIKPAIPKPTAAQMARQYSSLPRNWREGMEESGTMPPSQPESPTPPAAWMTSKYWKLPLNWEELIEQVRWAVGGKFTLEVEAPETLALVAEQQEQVGENRRLVHLINYAAPQGKTVSNVKVEVELPEGKGVRQVTLLTPDGEGKRTAPSQVAGGRARFTVPHLETYMLASIQME